MLKNWLSLMLAILSLILLVNFFWPREELFTAQLNLLRQPYSPISHLKLSRMFFNSGYGAEALAEYQKAQQGYQFFSFLDFNQKVAQNLVETEKLIYKPGELKKEVQIWEEVLKTKPYARDVLLQLAALNYQLCQNEKALDYYSRAFYLDPNNTNVQTIGKLLE